MLSPAQPKAWSRTDLQSPFRHAMIHFIQVVLEIIHVMACLLLMLVVLLQQGRGGGMGAAFGGATAQVFGGRGAGNLLTRTTGICAVIFMLTSVSLAYLSTSTDQDLAARIREEEKRTKDKPSKVKKEAEKPGMIPPMPIETAADAGAVTSSAGAPDAGAAAILSTGTDGGGRVDAAAPGAGSSAPRPGASGSPKP